jgi:transposase
MPSNPITFILPIHCAPRSLIRTWGSSVQRWSSIPRLRATCIYPRIRERGYTGSLVQLRRTVAHLRPPVREAFLRRETLLAEEGQVDWANFGPVAVGRARRTRSGFVMTLAYSRALYLEAYLQR